MTEKNVNLSWLKHRKSNEDKHELKCKILAAEDVLAVLSNLVAEKLKVAHDTQLSRSRFQEPSWAMGQADLNGYQRALEEIQNLLTFER